MNAKPSILPGAMTLEGDIEGEGDLVVFGRVAGSVRVSGALVLEASAEVRGDLHGATVTVRGTLVGNATAAETIWVDGGARVVGDLAAPRIKVVEGAAFRGRLHIGALATRAPGSLALRAGEVPAGDDDAPVRPAPPMPEAEVAAPRARLPRMPRVARASGPRRAAL